MSKSFIFGLIKKIGQIGRLVILEVEHSERPICLVVVLASRHLTEKNKVYIYPLGN